MTYIVRVLAIVRLAERQEIDDLVQEEMRIMGDRSGGKIRKS